MSSKSSPKTPERKLTPDQLPPVQKVQAELAHRYLRTLIGLVVRIVAVGLLVALLRVQVPALVGIQGVVDALSGVVVLVPFFLAVARVFRQRIASAKAYIEQERWEDAEALLTPVQGWQARFFDPAGEGLYWKATALTALNREDEAIPLYEQVITSGTGEWVEKAKAAHVSASKKAEQ